MNIIIFLSGLILGLWLNTNSQPRISLEEKKLTNEPSSKLLIREKDKILKTDTLNNKEIINNTKVQKKDSKKNNTLKNQAETVNHIQSFKINLLQQQFENALFIYENYSNNDNIDKYQSLLSEYIKNHIDKTESTKKLIELYLTYDYGNTKMLFYLSQIVFNEKAYFKAIQSLYDLKETIIKEHLKKTANKKLKQYIAFYLKLLKEEKNPTQLELFLKYINNKEPNNTTFIYELALYYFEINHYKKAQKQFQLLTDDMLYQKSAQAYLEKINKKLKLQNKFAHQIKLQKNNHHFYIKVTIDHIKLKLLIDTGATYTLINVSKLSHLSSNKSIILNTANGQKKASITNVDHITVDNVSLSNFEITLSDFDENDFDGLLGMNFLKNFDFYIDQEKAILYLK